MLLSKTELESSRPPSGTSKKAAASAGARARDLGLAAASQLATPQALSALTQLDGTTSCQLPSCHLGTKSAALSSSQQQPASGAAAKEDALALLEGSAPWHKASLAAVAALRVAEQHAALQATLTGSCQSTSHQQPGSSQPALLRCSAPCQQPATTSLCFHPKGAGAAGTSCCLLCAPVISWLGQPAQKGQLLTR